MGGWLLAGVVSWGGGSMGCADVEGGWLYLDLREPKYLDITAHALDGKAYPLSRGVLAVGRHGVQVDHLPNGVYMLKAGASFPGWTQRIVLTHSSLEKP